MVRDWLPAVRFSPAPGRAVGYELLTLGRKLGLTLYYSERVLSVGDRIDHDGTAWVVQRLEPPSSDRPNARVICFEDDAYAAL
jgi:hypothetical protein